MNKKDILEIMATLKVAYPTYYKDGGITPAINLWFEMFRDDEPALVAVAVKSYIASDVKGFPPAIGQLKSVIAKIRQPNVLTEVEAWGHVKRALKNSAWNVKEAHTKLPPIIQTMVSVEQLRDWGASDLADEQVIASNFMRSYRAKAKAVQEYDALPKEAKLVVEQCSTLQIGRIENETTSN